MQTHTLTVKCVHNINIIVDHSYLMYNRIAFYKLLILIYYSKIYYIKDISFITSIIIITIIILLCISNALHCEIVDVILVNAIVIISSLFTYGLKVSGVSVCKWTAMHIGIYSASTISAAVLISCCTFIWPFLTRFTLTCILNNTSKRGNNNSERTIIIIITTDND